MAKTQEELDVEQFDRLKRAYDSAMSKLGKNNASTKADGPEKDASVAYHNMVTFGRTRGLTNLVTIKKKYRRS